MSKANFLISSVRENDDRIFLDKEGLKSETMSVTVEMISSGNTSKVPTGEVLGKLMEHLSKFEL